MFRSEKLDQNPTISMKLLSSCVVMRYDDKSAKDLPSLETIELGNKAFNNAENVEIESRNLTIVQI